MSTHCDSHHVSSPQAMSPPVLTNVDDMTPIACHTSSNQVPPRLSSPVLNGSWSGEPIRHIPSIHDFLDVPTHVDCVVDDVTIPLGDVARHRPTMPAGSRCWQECPAPVAADPPLGQSVAAPAPPSLSSAHRPSQSTSIQREVSSNHRPIIPQLPLQQEEEEEGDRCSSRRGHAKQHSVASFAVKRSVRCKDSPSPNLPQHTYGDTIQCCHGNKPSESLTSDLIQPYPRVNHCAPHPCAPPLPPPPESPCLPPAPSPNMAALPYELLELLLSSLELSDLLACRAASRRLCAAASSGMRGGHRQWEWL